MEEIEKHIERHFGPIASVWHEFASGLVHIDVHVVNPTEEKPYYTLVTSGMSELPMTVPEDQEASAFAELMLCLPPDWPMTTGALTDDPAHWPIHVLKMVARLPHAYETWIAEWHSVPNGDPAQPYAPGSPFVGVLVAPMILCEPDARTIIAPAGKEISLLALVPLHAAELETKVAQGVDALLDGFDRLGVTELFDPARQSVV